MDNTDHNNSDLKILEQAISLDFSQATEPAPEMMSSILRSIEKRRSYLRRRALFSTIVLSALLMFFLKYFWVAIVQITQTETWSLVSIFFSDFKNVISNFNSYGLYFLESFPVIPVLSVLIGILIVIFWLKNLIKVIIYNSILFNQKI